MTSARPICATVSANALQHNLNVVKQHAPHSQVMAVVKANAYGHGLLQTAQALHQADAFAVLGLNEAIDLREAGIEQRILLLEGVFDARELPIAAAYQIDIAVHHAEQVKMLANATLAKPINVHLKMNTGMNRLGFAPQAFKAAYEQLSGLEQVSEIILMTHFATADETNGIESALSIFQTHTQGLDHAKSLANSASILMQPDSHADWVRPGIMLYGATPVSTQSATSFDLQPAMQLTSEIISVQTLAKGESVGYGARFTADKPMKIGIVACGYADGYPRHAGQLHDGDMLAGVPIAVHGQRTQTVGRVSMDMLACDLTHIPDAQIGSPVELWGNTIPVDEVAHACGTIGYELLCALAPRVRFQFSDL